MHADRAAGTTTNVLWLSRPAAAAASGESKEGTSAAAAAPASESPEDIDIDVAAQTLTDLLHYLRKTHLYCFFCAIKFDNVDDMAATCPGPYLLDHEEGESTALGDEQDAESDPRLLWSKPG